MMYRSDPLLALLGLFITWLALVGAMNRADAQGQANTEPPVRWGVFKNYQPVFIAQEAGFFAKEGVRVEFVGNFVSGPAIIQAAAANQVDAGHSATSGIINAVHAGVRVIGVADSQTEFFDAPLMQWYVLEGSAIRKGADLKGKTIGINSLSGSFFDTLVEYLARNGLNKDQVQLVLMPHHHQEQGLRSGQIDVASLIDPYTVLIQQHGGVRPLFRAVDILGENQFSLVFFRTEFVERHREVVSRFVRAYQRAIEFISTNPREAADIMARAIGISGDLVGIHRYTPHAAVRLRDAMFWISQMRKNGELNDDGKLAPADVATTEFAGQ